MGLNTTKRIRRSKLTRWKEKVNVSTQGSQHVVISTGNFHSHRGGSCFFFSLHVEQAYWTQALCKLQLVVGCAGTGSLDEDGLLFPWYHGEEIV